MKKGKNSKKHEKSLVYSLNLPVVTYFAMQVVSTNDNTQIIFTKWTNSRINGFCTFGPPVGATEIFYLL